MLFPCFLRKRCFSFLCRSSRPEVFCEKGVFRNFTKFTGKHLRQGLFFNKVAGFRFLLNSFFLNRVGFLFTYFKWISWNQIKFNEIYIKLFYEIVWKKYFTVYPRLKRFFNWISYYHSFSLLKKIIEFPVFKFVSMTTIYTRLVN